MVSDDYAIEAADGSPRCWACGKGSPQLDDRFCGGTCRAAFRRMVRDCPTPLEIELRASVIRSGWSQQEMAYRASGQVRGDGRRQPVFWTPPAVHCDEEPPADD